MSSYPGSSHPRLSASNLSTHRKDPSLDRAVIPYAHSSRSRPSTTGSNRPSELTIRPPFASSTARRSSSNVSSSSKARSSQLSHRPPSSAGGAKGTRLPPGHSMTVTDTFTTTRFNTDGAPVSSTSESHSRKITREDRMPVISEDMPQITYRTGPARSYIASGACPDCVPDSGEVRPDESASNVSRRSGQTAGSRPPSSNPRYSTYSGR
jgi:hypothetical protein